LKHRGGTLAVEDSILFIKTWCGLLPNQCDDAGSVVEEDLRARNRKNKQVNRQRINIENKAIIV